MGEREHNAFIVNLKKALGDRYNYDCQMEKKLGNALEVLARVKGEHPDLDMNYLVTGKRESVNMVAKVNITHSEVKYEDRSVNIDTFGDMTIDELIKKLSKQDSVIAEQVTLIRELIDSVDGIKKPDD